MDSRSLVWWMFLFGYHPLSFPRHIFPNHSHKSKHNVCLPIWAAAPKGSMIYAFTHMGYLSSFLLPFLFICLSGCLSINTSTTSISTPPRASEPEDASWPNLGLVFPSADYLWEFPFRSTFCPFDVVRVDDSHKERRRRFSFRRISLWSSIFGIFDTRLCRNRRNAHLLSRQPAGKNLLFFFSAEAPPFKWLKSYVFMS